LERQRITSTRLEDQDVVALVREGDAADVQVLFVRGGMLIGRRDFYFERAEPDAAALLTAVLQQFYDRDTVVPPEIVLPVDLPDEGVLAAWLAARRGARVRLTTPSRGPDAALLALALKTRKPRWRTTDGASARVRPRPANSRPCWRWPAARDGSKRSTSRTFRATRRWGRWWCGKTAR
jgi:excinuclease UvrABC nuclease subunit